MRGAVVMIASGAALLCATPLRGQEPAAGTVSSEESTLQFGHAQERMTVPVLVGTSGPYRFIVDTGSQSTVISLELAEHLKLAPGRPVKVTAMTGTSLINTVVVPGLTDSPA